MVPAAPDFTILQLQSSTVFLPHSPEAKLWCAAHLPPVRDMPVYGGFGMIIDRRYFEDVILPAVRALRQA